MKIPMTDEQRRRLAEYLSDYKRTLERSEKRDIEWKELADKIPMDAGLLRQLAKGTRRGMNWETTVKLVRGFGLRVLEILGVDLGAPPLFKLDNGEG